jgi:hypothetical protein
MRAASSSTWTSLCERVWTSRNHRTRSSSVSAGAASDGALPQSKFDGVDQRGLAARPPSGEHRDTRPAVGGRRLELDLSTPHHSRYRLCPEMPAGSGPARESIAAADGDGPTSPIEPRATSTAPCHRHPFPLGVCTRGPRHEPCAHPRRRRRVTPQSGPWTPEPFVADDGAIPFRRFVNDLSDFKFIALDTAIVRVLSVRGIDLATPSGSRRWARACMSSAFATMQARSPTCSAGMLHQSPLQPPRSCFGSSSTSMGADDPLARRLRQGRRPHEQTAATRDRWGKAAIDAVQGATAQSLTNDG